MGTRAIFDMKQDKTILELLMEISEKCTKTTVLGVEMQIIDSITAEKLLGTDPNDNHIHECTLANGTFLFTMQNNKLHTLFKIQPSPL